MNALVVILLFIIVCSMLPDMPRREEAWNDGDWRKKQMKMMEDLSIEQEELEIIEEDEEEEEEIE